MNLAKSISNERMAWGALVMVLVLTGILRYNRLNVPLERDEGEYAYAGQLMLQGIPPYQEVYNMKFPGVYAAYALFLAIFGQSYQSIHAALLIMNAITIIIVFLLAKHLVNRLCAVIAAASFALLSISQPVQGLFANAEHFVIVFATGGLLLLLQGLATASLLRLFASGLLLGLGFTMKQHGIAFILLAGLYIIFDAWRQRPGPWRNLGLKLLTFTGGVFIVLSALCLILAWTGVLKSFWFWTFDYASAYVSQVPLSQAGQVFLSTFTTIVHSAPFLWILAGLGLLTTGLKRIAKHHKVFLWMYTVFSLLAICPGFYFRPHYFVLLLPCASLLVGVTVTAFADFLSRFSLKKIQYGVPIFLWVICSGQSIYQQRDFLFYMTPVQICRSTYWLNPFPESLKIADFIQKHTRPEDRIAVLGSEPQIFFYAQRRSASGYIYMYPMMEHHDFALQMQKEFIKDIETANPKYLVYVGLPTSWLRRDDSHPEIFQWIDHYLKRDDLKLVGVVELAEDKIVYHWEPDAKWSVPSRFWVCIFERTG